MCTNLLLYLFNSFVQQPITGISVQVQVYSHFCFSRFFLKQYHWLINTNTLLKYVHCLQVEHHGHGHVSSQQQHKSMYVLKAKYVFVLYLIFSSPCQNLKCISYAVKHHIFHEFCFQAWVVFFSNGFCILHAQCTFLYLHSSSWCNMYWWKFLFQ